MAVGQNRAVLARASVSPAVLVACWLDVATGPEHLVGPAWALALSGSVASLALLWRRSRPLPVQLGVAAAVSVPWFVWGASQSTAIFLPVAVSTFATGRFALERPGW